MFIRETASVGVCRSMHLSLSEVRSIRNVGGFENCHAQTAQSNKHATRRGPAVHVGDSEWGAALFFVTQLNYCQLTVDCHKQLTATHCNRRLFIVLYSDSQNSRRARNIILELENFFESRASRVSLTSLLKI